MPNTITDGGPQYAETDLSLFIVEPFNTVTAFLFVLLGTYWILKLRRQLPEQLFLFIISLILMVGSIGGTLYHAFRTSRFFLFMDWVPIMLILLITVYYILFQLFATHWKVIILFLGMLFLPISLRKLFVANRNLGISLNYILMASMVLLPLFFYLLKTSFQNYKWVAFALASFAIAISFRILDLSKLLPMGTHFLWHLFGALATHFLFEYLYRMHKSPSFN
jgi:hemolysin III